MYISYPLTIDDSQTHLIITPFSYSNSIDAVVKSIYMIGLSKEEESPTIIQMQEEEGISGTSTWMFP